MGLRAATALTILHAEYQGIYSLSIDTKALKRLTNHTKLNGFVRYPAWSPNQIVYENVETAGNIWMLKLK
jgi:Tol biopolymer transport system component